MSIDKPLRMYSIQNPQLYPLVTHLLFGAIAGLVGSLAVLWVKHRRRD